MPLALPLVKRIILEFWSDPRCKIRRVFKSGRSSGVERNLAKVEVVSSNLIARSIFPKMVLNQTHRR